MLDTDDFTLGQVLYMNIMSCAIPMGIVRESCPHMNTVQNLVSKISTSVILIDRKLKRRC
jgi:hypothetical protein